MESVATGLSSLLASFGSDAAKQRNAALNNQRFKNAVLSTWRDNPDAARYLLAHTNGIYVKKDDAPRRASAPEHVPVVLGVYLDDALARSEINARRELLLLALAKQGMSIDEVRDHQAIRGMRDRHVFPDASACAPQPSSASVRASGATPRAAKRAGGAQADQSTLLETMKRAFCLAFPDLDDAETILDEIEGAALVEAARPAGGAHAAPRYRCHLYVDAARADGMRAILDRHGATVISKADQLGMRVLGFIVHECADALRGRRAFPRAGRPVPLRPEELRALADPAARAETAAPRASGASRPSSQTRSFPSSAI